jgi:hypothetical protein
MRMLLLRADPARKWMCGATALILLIGLAAAPAAGTGVQQASAKSVGGATFDLSSMFSQQMLSPSTGSTKTFLLFDTRNIVDTGQEIKLKASPDSSLFTATVKPAVVRPEGASGSVRSRVDVECSDDTPEGTVGWIKVVGTRGGESHRLWLKVTALASRPKIEMSMGVPLSGTGPGHEDAELQAFTGKTLSWHVAAKNEGATDDTYALSYKAGFPVSVSFVDIKNKKVDKVHVKGTTRNLLFSKPVELRVDARPQVELPKNKPQDMTIVLGPGRHTGKTVELPVKVVNPGMLFCVNDVSGLQPHAHQAMPGETTSFVFHVTNLDSRPADIRLIPPAGGESWGASLDRTEFPGLRPGATADAVLTAEAPAGASPGDRLVLTVSAESSTGRREESTVAAEVTSTRNIYYWSIDSMDPEYMYMDASGTGQGKEGDWLMPNTQAFIKDAANYTDSRVYLPSATDMNHTNALAGSYTGTDGVYMVGGTFVKFTDHDEVICEPNSTGLMRYGADGQPIQRVYEVAKAQTGGKSLGGFWSNKNWLAELEGERTVDVVGHSERWPLFFKPPYKYDAAGDPKTDNNPSDPISTSARALFHSNNFNAVVLPTILGQFDLYFGTRLLTIPIAKLFGMQPGMHAEDRYIADSFFRTIEEEDPDVSYVNIGDLDNTGHFTGASWPQDEWNTKGTADASDDTDKYSPYMRRDDCIDIAREADGLFGDFVKMLKDRGVYDNSIIVFLSDHGMENMKDPKSGYQVIDLRQILRDHGFVRHEDYEESGGTEINLIWFKDPEKAAAMEKVLKDFTIEDPELGQVSPLTVIDRREMKSGVDFGKAGRVRPMELYSEYWINHPDEPGGHIWPDLFVFPLYNYQIMAHGDVLSTGVNAVGINLGINTPESVRIGLPGAHGGLQTDRQPLVFKAPAGYTQYGAGSSYGGEVEIGDIAPTIYKIMGWPEPANVDGKPLP